MDNLFDWVRGFPPQNLVIEVKCKSLFIRKHLKEILEATIDREARLALGTRYYAYGF
jgi:hypothetical protein